jgi:hypothetical protein
MHRFFLLLMLMPTLTAFAQQAGSVLAAGSKWQRVEALPPGTKIDVSARSGSKRCFFKSADATSLTCVAKGEIVFQQAEIKAIKIRHRGRSAAVGAAIGAGVGVAAAEAAWKPTWFPFSRSQSATAVALPIGGVGAVIGALTDFTGSTIYRAR